MARKSVPSEAPTSQQKNAAHKSRQAAEQPSHPRYFVRVRPGDLRVGVTLHVATGRSVRTLLSGLLAPQDAQALLALLEPLGLPVHREQSPDPSKPAGGRPRTRKSRERGLFDQPKKQ
jgi:hypothetical protein